MTRTSNTLPMSVMLPLARLVRPERSFERFSQGAELVGAIEVQRDGEQHPNAGCIMDAFDLTIIEWHYWRKIVEIKGDNA